MKIFVECCFAVFTLITLYRAIIVKFITVYQQCSYRAKEYLPCLKGSLCDECKNLVMCSVSGLLFSVAVIPTGDGITVGALCYALTVALAIFFCRSVKIKSNAKTTARFLRIRIVGFVIFAFFSVAVTLMVCKFNVVPELVFYSSTFFCLAFLPFTPILSAFFWLPYDRVKYNFYIKETREILEKRPDLIKIGVTGSCGKTTVKKYLKNLLSLKYEVLATPESYNTPLGICLSLKNLKPSTQIFIAEMGARRVGDISELCKIVQPDIAVVTGIAAQHLETFGSVGNIIKEKSVITRNIGKDGFAVISADTSGSLEIYVGCSCEKILAGINACAAVKGENLRFYDRGTKFLLSSGGKKYSVFAPFYGRHNVTDFLLAFAVAEKLGVPPERMVAAARRLSPPEHRFSVKKTPSDVTVIDDGYNANIDGVKSGAETLAYFGGRKIVVTSGIAECGAESEKLNREVGRITGEVADILIAVGTFSKYIVAGAEGTKAEIKTADGLADAREILKSVVKAGDCVMFINDLPDRY